MIPQEFSAELSRLRTEFEDHVKDLRPELHRYCSRILGSVIDAEDVVQEALAKAFYYLPTTVVTNMKGWLFRVAHNRAMDHLRLSGRERLDDLDDYPAANEPDLPLERKEALGLAMSFFMQLTVKQRCCVVLKDVMDHSLAEISELLDASVSEVKASLYRGRVRLRELGQSPWPPTPVLDPDQIRRLEAYVEFFNARDYEAVKALLADDVKLDMVSRSQRRGAEVGLYFTRYAEMPQWSFAVGRVDGLPAVLIYTSASGSPVLHSFVLLTWTDGKIAEIRDYLFVPYVISHATVVDLTMGEAS